MTRHARRARQVVVVVDVTIRALARRHGVRTGQNESGARVIELAVRPGHSVVTLRARGWETGMRNRRGRGVVVGLMATDAGGCGDIVVVIYVTVRTLPRRNRMRTAQNESGGRVIELAIRPGHGVMTLRAGCRETGVRHRRCGLVVVRLMATDAGGRGDVEVVIDVTVRTLPRRNCVRTAERESSGRVIELRVRPLHRIVALLTRSRESGVRHRAYRIVEVVLMAADACGARNIEIVIDVAICTLARGNGVRTRQHKIHRGVIEFRRLPRRGGVALQAIRGEVSSHVVRILGGLKILEVAGQASRGRQGVVVIRVAIRALARWHSVPARQQETGGRVVKLRVQPVVTGMACVAIRRELCGDVIGICGRLKIFEVAGSAGR